MQSPWRWAKAAPRKHFWKEPKMLQINLLWKTWAVWWNMFVQWRWLWLVVLGDFHLTGVWLWLSGWWSKVRPQRLPIVDRRHCQASPVQVNICWSPSCRLLKRLYISHMKKNISESFPFYKTLYWDTVCYLSVKVCFSLTSDSQRQRHTWRYLPSM